MITLKQIALSINQKLIEILPKIPIQSKDISEGFNRPSLFVDFDDVVTAAIGARGRKRIIPVTIYFFPTDRHQYKLEILDVQEIIERAFTKGVNIGDGVSLCPLEVSSVKTDGVLQCSFDIQYIEIDDREEGEDITTLQLSIEKRE